MTTQLGPMPAAQGLNGHWVKLGNVSVDSATIAITDPAFAKTPYGGWTNYNDNAEDYGSGVQLWAGFGDGGYDVWGWVVDYGENGEVDERVAKVIITMIDESVLDHWRSLP